MELKIDHKVVRDLMDSDPEFKVQVKEAILKTAVKNQAWKMVNAEMRDIINGAITKCHREHLDRVGNGRVVSASIEKIIADRFEDELNATISVAVEGVRADTLKNVQERADRIKRQANEYIESVINKKVAEHINAQVMEKLQEVVESIPDKTFMEEQPDKG